MAYPTGFQPAQPNALRILNRKYSELERSKWSTVKTLTRGVSSSAWELAYKFAQTTTIHGLNRLLGRTSGKYERLIWLLTVVSAFLGALYVCDILSERYTEGKLETVVDTIRLPVYIEAFPVITICNANHLNWKRIDEAKKRFLPHEQSSEVLDLFELVISRYDRLYFGAFDVFSVLEGKPLSLVNHINFTQVLDFMTWRCEEIVTDCEWNRNPFNCCELLTKRHSKNGICWAFNTLETEEGRDLQRLDHFYPWHTGAAGPGSGLRVKVLINADKHFPNASNDKAIRVMVTEQYVWHIDPIDLPANTYTWFDIEPVTYLYDDNTRGLPSSLRECLFKDEHGNSNFKTLNGYVYMHENCESQCHQEYLLNYCNCTMDLLFPPANYRPCKAKDLPCLARYNHHFRLQGRRGEEQYVKLHNHGMCCKCFRNCQSLNFFPNVRQLLMPDEVRGNLSFVHLDVYYRAETAICYRTTLIFTWVDLLVAFGGIAGLFLGCSLISAIELSYFLLVEFPTFFYSKCKQNWRQRRANMDNMRNLNANNIQIGTRQYNAYINHEKLGQPFGRATNW